MSRKLAILILSVVAVLTFAGSGQEYVRPVNPHGLIRLHGSDAAEKGMSVRSLEDMLVRYRFTPGGYGELQRRLINIGVDVGAL